MTLMDPTEELANEVLERILANISNVTQTVQDTNYAANFDLYLQVGIYVVAGAAAILFKIFWSRYKKSTFSDKPLTVTDERGQQRSVAITEKDIENNNGKTTLEDRIAIRVKAVLETGIENIKEKVQEVKIEQVKETASIDYIGEKLTDQAKKIDNIDEKQDRLSKEVAEHAGFVKAKTELYDKYIADSK